MARRRRRGLSYLPAKPICTPIIIYLLLAALFFGAIFYFKSNIVKTVKGQVVDAYTGLPVVGATVLLENEVRLAKTAGINASVSQDSNTDGNFEFDKATDKYSLTATANNYRSVKLELSGVYTSQLKLVPTTVRGTVTDAQGNRLARASISFGNRAVLTDNDGSYSLTDAPEKGEVTVRAAGFKPTKASFDRSQKLDVQLQPLVVKGVYLRAAVASDPGAMAGILNLINTTELTTVVIDVKDSNGLVFYDTKVPLARPAADNKGKIKDLGGMVKTLHERGIYTIGRISVFQDATLSDVKPEWTLKSKTNGANWADAARFNWMNPYLPEVWDYNIKLAKELAGLGLDEVQFAFAHFPQTGNLGDIEYGRTSDAGTRTEAITSFLRLAREQLTVSGTATSAEVLGAGVLESGDLGIGQSIESIANEVDYISPVLFPSYFGKGSFSYEKPAAQPYEVINKCITFARTKLQGKRAQLRPWLQDFSAEGINYGAKEVRDEIRAVEENAQSNKANVGWMLWNNEGRYTLPALAPKNR